jgi:hypothetical protein
LGKPTGELYGGKELRQMQRMFLTRFFSYHIAEYHCDQPGTKKPFERFVGTDGDQSLLTKTEATEVGSNIIANNQTAWKNEPRMQEKVKTIRPVDQFICTSRAPGGDSNTGPRLA